MTDRMPARDRNAFHCAHCDVYAEQGWYAMQVYRLGGYKQPDGWSIGFCTACKDFSIWHYKSMIYPFDKQGALPHEDMPEDVRAIYEEAREVAPISRKSAAGLLRLALQMLVDELEPGSGGIDQKIGKLVQRGLDPQVQKAMDVLRVAGNESVHPGTIDLDADPDMLTALFRLTNLIVEQVIARPKHIDSLFAKLPESKREAIERRDGATAT